MANPNPGELIKPPKLTFHNWSIWRRVFKARLQMEQSWGIISGADMAQPGEGADVHNQRELKGARIYGLLTRYISEDVLNLIPDQVAGETNAMFARRCFDTLAGHFDVGQRQRSRLARTQLMNFKMQGTETMTSYLNRFMLVISQAVDAQIALPEAEKIEILLNGLRESSEYRSVSANLLSQANLNGAITSTQICNELRCYASCQPCEKDDEKAFHVNTAVAKNQGEKGKGQKFKPNNKGTFPKWGCAICDSKDHKTYQCPRKREVQEMIKK